MARRGRPPKAAATKRGPGRPPKHRGPGRPPGSKNKTTTTGGAKRGPGRPPKALSAKTPAKRIGRPPGSTNKKTQTREQVVETGSPLNFVGMFETVFSKLDRIESLIDEATNGSVEELGDAAVDALTNFQQTEAGQAQLATHAEIEALQLEITNLRTENATLKKQISDLATELHADVEAMRNVTNTAEQSRNFDHDDSLHHETVVHAETGA